jgi:hypothetical protein
MLHITPPQGALGLLKLMVAQIGEQINMGMGVE